MRVTLKQLGIAFDGHCLGCGELLDGDMPYECATTFCVQCRTERFQARLVPYEPRDPAVKKAERDELIATYLHTTWGDVLPKQPVVVAKPKRKRKAARG